MVLSLDLAMILRSAVSATRRRVVGSTVQEQKGMRIQQEREVVCLSILEDLWKGISSESMRLRFMGCSVSFMM